MNRKPMIVLVMIAVLLSVPINFIFSNNPKNIDMTLANVEALAAIENNGKPIRDCIAVGGICIGVNAAGELGTHVGVTLKK